jgi:tRNA threonylcarbamoyladenosine biosynthesis protein TsaE
MLYMSTVMTWQTRSRSFADTEKLGEQLGRLAQPPLVLELRSDLGGGKTTFVRGLAKGLGIEAAVSSPSFTLSQEYPAKSGEKLYHFDFYRLAESGVVGDQLGEAIADPNGIVAIEWSDIVQDILPSDYMSVEFKPTVTSGDERGITITYSEKYSSLVRRLEEQLNTSQP